MNKPLPSQEVLKEYLEYSIVTGSLYLRKKTHNNDRRHPNEKLGSLDTHGYLRINFMGTGYRLNRLIWMLVTDEDPEDKDVDHIDRNKSNNSWINLRLVTKNESNQNRIKPKESTLPTGVTLTGSRYMARIQENGTRRYLGQFKTIEEAEQAYLAAQLKLHGEFAPVN